MADDMGYGDLGSVNGGLSTTPRLDAFAAESLRLTQGYSASCVCAPARAGFMTGRYPQRTGVLCLNDFHGLNRLAPQEQTLGDVFAHNGYQTCLVGKWHLGTAASCRPNRRGFQEFHGFLGGGKDYWAYDLNHNGSTRKADGRTYLTDELTGLALDFLRTAIPRSRLDGPPGSHASAGSAPEPFYLHLAYTSPHRPLQAQPELLKKYTQRHDLTPGQAHIYAMLESMDTGIGRVLDALESSGAAENTIVAFVSDNGPDPMDDGGLSPVRPNCGLNGTKYQVYEGGIRVPFLIRWPAGLAGSGVNRSLVHFIDVLPTLVALCGLEKPRGPALDGIDRSAALRGEADPDPQRFWQWNRYLPLRSCNAAMRDGDWKMVQPEIPGCREMHRSDTERVKRRGGDAVDDEGITPPPDRALGSIMPPQLYNLALDPGESKDLAREDPTRAAKMAKQLERWYDDVLIDFRKNYAAAME